MVKKKKCRQKHQEPPGEHEHDTSEEEEEDQREKKDKSCSHVTKGVNLSAIKKSLKGNHVIGKCQVCDAKSDKSSEETKTIAITWICLQCGHQGCDGDGLPGHALLHHRTPRSDCHSIVVNISTRCAWCYECGHEISIELSRHLSDCVDYIKKHATSGQQKNFTTNSSVKSCSYAKSEPALPPLPHEPGMSRTTKEETFKKKEDKPKNCIKKSNKAKLKGLSNLGNTCFFNAVMQNLIQTPWFYKQLSERCQKGYAWHIERPLLICNKGTSNRPEEDGHSELKSLDVILQDSGPLTRAVLSLLQLINSSSSPTVTPDQLFKEICKKAPQFSGFQQQDSHEVLRHLLDGIRNEEIKRQKAAILKAFNLNQKVNPCTVDDKTKNIIKAYGYQASHTIIDSLFGGQLLSTILCAECNVASQNVEPLMDLSLPVAEDKPIKPGNLKSASTDDSLSTKLDYKVSYKGNSEPRISKHQEKKMKKQARRQASSRNHTFGKTVETCTPATYIKNDGLASDESILAESETVEDSWGVDQTEADVEDNDDSETMSNLNCELLDDCAITVSNLTPTVKNSSINCSEQDVPDDIQFSNEDKCSSYLKNSNQISEVEVTVNDSSLCTEINNLTIGNKQKDQNGTPEVSKDQNVLCNGNLDSYSSHVTGNGLQNGDEVESEDCSAHTTSTEWLSRSLTTLAPRSQSQPHTCSVLSCLNIFTAPELLVGSNKFGCENCTRLKRQENEKTGSDKKVQMVYTNAQMQLLIFSPPAILTLHLKRFQQVGMSLRKVNRCIEFPLLLDLAPYCSSLSLILPHVASDQSKIMYSLFGVVEHTGRLTSGHYSAYVKVASETATPSFLTTWPINQCKVEHLIEELSSYSKISNKRHNNDNCVSGQWYYVSDTHVREASEQQVLKCQAYLLFYQRIE